jgi:chlorobactene glucosyltransferase
MAALFWITVVIGGLWILIFVSNTRELRRTPRLRPRPVGGIERLPSVSILVPARDEEANIRRCLRSLMDLVHPDLEIIVIDDRSSDQTATIVERLARLDPRIRLIRLQSEPPAGWMGKCHALHQGVVQGRPRGEWLLFTDADTMHHPDSLAVALREALDHQADFFSLIPHLEAFNFWERLLQPTVAGLIAMFNRPGRINDPDRPDVFANGQYILMHHEAYRSVGGHESVAGKVLEDVELARVTKALGLWVRLAVGVELFRTRMYPDLRSLLRGWAKNLFLLLDSRLSRVLAATAAALLFSVWPAAAGIGALICLAGGHQPLPLEQLLIVTGIYAAVTGMQAGLRWMNRWYPVLAPLAPLANLVALGILWHSTWLHLGRRAVTWKGRAVVDRREAGP